MNFIAAIRTCLQKYFTFSGRARRKEYWYFVLFSVLIPVPFAVLDMVLGLEFSPGQAGPLELIVSLALIIPSASAAARRLHDINRSGWWQLIVITLIGIPVLIYWLCCKGTEGDNRFGADPLTT